MLKSVGGGRKKFPTGNLSKNEKVREKFLKVFFQKMFPVSRIVPKTLRSPLCSQNFWFLVKIEECFGENKLEKKLHSTEKTDVLKNSDCIEKIVGECIS